MSYKDRAAACLLILILLHLSARAVPGQPVPAETDPVLATLGDKIRTFLEGVSVAEAQNAYQELLVGSQLLKQEKALQKLIDKTKQLQTTYGRYCGFEQIAAARVGKDLVLFQYLYKCESYPVVWYFTFYRTRAPGEAAPESGDWRVIDVRFDTDLERLASWGQGGRVPPYKPSPERTTDQTPTGLKRP
jgi:hypothetical protein